MPHAKASTKPPLSRTSIFLRAALAAFLAFLAGGVIIVRLGAENDDFLLGPPALVLFVVRVGLTLLAFGLTWWRLRARRGTPPPATPFGRLVRAAGVGVVAWAVAIVFIVVAWAQWQLLPPPGFDWAVGVAASVAWWRHGRARPPESETSLRRATAWGVIVAGTFGLIAGAIAFVASAVVWRLTPYAWAPFVVGPLVAYLVHRFVAWLDRLGLILPPAALLLSLIGVGVAGASEKSRDD